MHGNGLRRGRQRISLTTGRVTKNPRRKRHSKAKIKTLDAESAEEDAAVEAIDISLSALFDVQFQCGTLFTRFDARDVNI